MNEGRWVWCPPGWRVVPRAPTDAMCRASEDSRPAEQVDDPYHYTRADIEAAIAAAPAPPSGWHPISTVANSTSSALLVCDGHYFQGQRWTHSHAIGSRLERDTLSEYGYTHWAEMVPPPDDKP
jgi:hypothetical protein